VLDPKKTNVLPGDIIVQNRAKNTQIFEQSTYSGPSHGDIVTVVVPSLTGPAQITAVGGNVSNSVKGKQYEDKHIRSKYFVILRNTSLSTAQKLNISTIATDERNRWKNGEVKETDPENWEYLHAYYRAVGMFNGSLYSDKSKKNPILNA
jgi:hypothetical protein